MKKAPLIQKAVIVLLLGYLLGQILATLIGALL